MGFWGGKHIGCSTCKYIEVMYDSDGYYCSKPGGPWNYAHQQVNGKGNVIIGYTIDDIECPCCNGEKHEPYDEDGSRKFNEEIPNPNKQQY